MTREEADELLEQIQEMAFQIEDDEELKALDMRYSITARWIDTDISNTSV